MIGIGLGRGLGVVSLAVLMLMSGAKSARASVCTLADHIRAANTNTAVGFCPAGTSHDIITITDDIVLSEALPAITGTITIEGGGHRISGDAKYPIFVVIGGNLTINNLTLSEGYFEGSRDSSWVGAGGLQVREGGRAAVNHSVFINNRSGRGHGGAIAVDRGALTVKGSAFIKNRSKGQGGAIYVWDSEARISNSSFVENETRGVLARGGGVYTGFRSTLEISNSTFIRNFATAGGGVGTDYSSLGPARTTLTHVTMILNRAPSGQNIYIDEKDSAFNLRNSFLGVATSTNLDGRLNQSVGNLLVEDMRWDGSPSTRFAEIAGAPAYFPLQDGSPAIDAADPRFCPDVDQIGTPRPQGAGCDIGAIETMTATPAPTAEATHCALPDQIIAANTDRAHQACAAGNGADTIYMIRDYALREPLPGITSDITIEGNGFTISAEGRFHILDVDGGALTVRDLTLTKGNANRGGAIRLRNGASVHAANIRFVGNEAIAGGAISTASENDRLIITNSSFVDNRARSFGGAILVDGGRVEVSGSAFLNNQAREKGGALAATRGRADLANGTFHGNRAWRGGAIHVGGATVALRHVTLMRNAAERLVGAGIYAEWGEAFLRNSIVAGSGIGIGCYGRLAESRGSLSEDGTCAALSGDPGLGGLAGAPAHHPLLDASPAHGSGDPSFCLAVDQLGNPRPHCDIGAVESARAPDFSALQRTRLPDDCTLAEQIIAANTDAPAGSCPAGAGADLINLERNIKLREALPAIKGDLIIDGRGHTISGDNRLPIFVIEAGDVVIKNMDLIKGSNGSGYGGAIALRNDAALRVANVRFRHNRARYGGAIAATGVSTLKAFDNIFIGNAAERGGGAIWIAGRCGIIDNNQFRGSSSGAPAANEEAGGVKTRVHVDGATRPCLDEAVNYYSDD